jgi:ABC-2 type transport system permease protein
MSIAMAIARREFKAFFQSPIAYIVIGVFLIWGGWLFFSTFFVAGVASLRSYFAITPLVFIVFAPAVTMRLIAEERKSGTMELLLSMPVRDWEVVLGKFIAALGMVAVALLWTLPYAVTAASLTASGVRFDWGPVIAGYIGLLLMASSFLSIGLWASAMSRNQIVGFIVGLLICFSFWFVDKFAIFLPATLGELLQFLSVDYHFENIARGVFDTRDIVYYLSLTAAGLVLTNRSLSAARQ